MTVKKRIKAYKKKLKEQGYKTFEGLVTGKGKPKDMYKNENN